MNLQLFLSIILYFNIFYPSIQTLATETIQKTSIPHLLNETNHNSLDFIRNLEETSDKKAEDAHLITLNLYGNISMGYYFIELFFGSNLQKQSLIVGTGNTLTAVPCQKCEEFCGKNHLNPFYDPEISATYKEVQSGDHVANYQCTDEKCEFRLRYSEGSSYEGHYVKDYISFTDGSEDGSSPKSPVNRVFSAFGCIMKETKMFFNQRADGILGLGVQTNNVNSPPSFIQSLHFENQDYSQTFSICLARDGGYFTIGGYNTAYHDPNEKAAFIPYFTDFDEYKVKIKSIEVAGDALDIDQKFYNSNKGASFDSGTTFMYVGPKIYLKLIKKLQELCAVNERCGKHDRVNCYHHDTNAQSLSEFFSKFPILTFNFLTRDSSYPYELRGEDYLYEKDPNSHNYCVGIEPYDDKFTIFGSLFMRNHDILFDKDNKRIGFIRSDCSRKSKPALVAKSDTPNKQNPDLNESTIPQSESHWFLYFVLIFASALGGYFYLKSKKKQPKTNHKKVNEDEEGNEMVTSNKLEDHDKGEEED